MKKIAAYIFGVVLLLGAGGAGSYFYLEANAPTPPGEEEEEVIEIEPEPIYIKLDPPLVVNFTHRGSLRYLQTSFELMHTEQSIIDSVSAKMPVIRNNLILVLSDQTYEDLSSKSAKEDLRRKISETITEIVHAEPPVEIYITNFVMQ